jgi:hypothetical protein
MTTITPAEGRGNFLLSNPPSGVKKRLDTVSFDEIYQWGTVNMSILGDPPRDYPIIEVRVLYGYATIIDIYPTMQVSFYNNDMSDHSTGKDLFVQLIQIVEAITTADPAQIMGIEGLTALVEYLWSINGKLNQTL